MNNDRRAFLETMVKMAPISPEAVSQLGAYTDALVGLTSQAWQGQVAKDEFEVEFLLEVRDGLEEAWRLALKECGLDEGDLTDSDYEVLDNEQDAAERALQGFEDWLFERTSENGYEFAESMWRITIWVNRWTATYYGTKAQSCTDVKLKWRYTEGKDHCDDCKNYNGRVYRASVWYEQGIYPQNVQLGCHGFNCGCRFEETDDPVTPGVPPPMTFAENPEAAFAHLA